MTPEEEARGVLLGERIKNHRQASGLTLRGFARAVGIAPAFVVDIESGHRMPGHDVLGRIAATLGIPLAELQALDPRITPEVREWMDGDPCVSAFLRWLRARPDRNDLMARMMRAERHPDDPDKPAEQE